MRFFFPVIFLFNLTFGNCQSHKLDSSLQIHGGIDYYFGMQLNDVESKQIPLYVSNNVLGEPTINLALVEISYKPTNRIRFQFSPGFGSYMNSNYAGEKKWSRWIYEGYVGFKPNKKKDEWLDVGVFSSPYTYEFAKGWEQTFMTRALAPEYVPYYLLGARYKKKLSTHFNLTFFLLNGWQHIDFQKKIPSLGTQLEYTKNKHYVSWTTYHGNEKSNQNPLFGYRFFTEMSWIFTSKNVKLLSCGYIGMQQKETKFLPWGQFNFSGEFKIQDNLFLNSRFEHFVDPHNIQLVQANTPGFNCSGLSLGLRYNLTNHLTFRFETKALTDNTNAGYFNKKGQQIKLLPLSFLGIQIKF